MFEKYLYQPIKFHLCETPVGILKMEFIIYDENVKEVRIFVDGHMFIK